MAKNKNAKNRSSDQSGSSQPAGVAISDWQASGKIEKKLFPASGASDVSLRIHLNRESFAEVTAHARQSTEKEVCGVLVGRIKEDDLGRYPDVVAAVRGTAVDQGGQHVTYTQETWTSIHNEIDQKYPGMAILGWYHSHPGFGVTFSDMDRFIQQNFFSGPEQFGLVTDPLGGDLAVMINTGKGIETISHFWVDSRKQKCWTPPKPVGANNGMSAMPSDLTDRFKELDSRITQVVQALDETRASVYKVVLTAVMLICSLFVIWIGSKIVTMIFAPERPPLYHENVATVPAFIKLNDKNVTLNLRVDASEIPPEYNLQLQQDRLIQAEVNKALQTQALSFQYLLASATPEELSLLAENAKKMMPEEDTPLAAPMDPLAAAKPKPGSNLQIYLLWGAIAMLVVVIGSYLYSSIKSDQK